MPYTTRWILLTIFVLGLGPTSSAQAQLTLRASHSGAAHSSLTGGGYALQATAGQPAVAISGNGQPYYLGSGFWYAARNAEVALPVDLVSFTASISDETVTLVWTTASETNNDGFRVERATESLDVNGSTNGAEANSLRWAEVGAVTGTGTTTDAQTYRFRDASVPFQARTLSYRLRQIDVDRGESLSDPVRVTRDTPEALELRAPFPNPARSVVTLQYALPEAGAVALELYDVLGRRVATFDRGTLAAGPVEQRLDTSGLPSGLYFLRLVTSGQMRTARFTVVR